MVSFAGGLGLVGHGDAEPGALPLDLSLPGAHLLQGAAVPGDRALVAARVALEPARLRNEIAHASSAAACCMTSRPKRASAVAAAVSSSAVNSSASPAGSPLV